METEDTQSQPDEDSGMKKARPGYPDKDTPRRAALCLYFSDLTVYRTFFFKFRFKFFMELFRLAALLLCGELYGEPAR